MLLLLFMSSSNLWGGVPQTQNLFIKNCIFIVTCYSSLSFKVLSIWCNTPIQKFFSTAQNSFWTHRFGCLLALLLFFVSPLPHQQNGCCWRHFSSGETTKSCLGKIRWIGSVGNEVHDTFGQTLLNTQRHVGRCAHKSPIMEWTNALKEASKKFTECSLSQQHQLVHWYRWVPRTLT